MYGETLKRLQVARNLELRVLTRGGAHKRMNDPFDGFVITTLVKDL